jgi:hypothetical protein
VCGINHVFVILSEAKDLLFVGRASSHDLRASGDAHPTKKGFTLFRMTTLGLGWT